MNLTREHIIPIVALIIVIGVIGGVYQFYYKQKVAEYNEAAETLETYKTVLDRLEKTFENHDPAVLIQHYNMQVQPLAEDVVRRAQFFNIGDVLDVEPVPENVMLRFYYEEQFNKLMQDFHQDANSRVPFCEYPRTTTYGAPRPEELEGRRLEPGMILGYLQRLRFGNAAMKMLFDAKAKYIVDVQIWRPRPGANGMLLERTVGLHFFMDLKDLVKFLDELRLSDRYYNVNGLRIQNRMMISAAEPPVEVEMLLTQAQYTPPKAAETPAGAPGGPGGPAGPAMAGGAPAFGPGQMTAEQMLAQRGFQRRPREQEAPPTRLQRIGRWFRKYFWPF